MSFNGNTYISDFLFYSGFENMYRSSSSRYFSIEENELLLRLSEDHLILLPSEPYTFDETQIPDIAATLNVRREQCLVVPGEYLTWYGLITLEALQQIHKIYATIFGP